MCFHKGCFWHWIVIPAYGNYTENQEQYSWNLTETLSNYESGQLCLDFTLNYVYSKKNFPSNT